MQSNTDFSASRIAQSYMDMVYRLALNYLKKPEAADDVTQEVFVRLLRAKTSFESEEHVKRWLIKVTINECKRYNASLPWKDEPLDDYADKLSFSSDEVSDVFQAVMSLPGKYSSVIHLHYYEEYSTSEIAQILKIPHSTVRTRLERGRKMLKEKLSEVENV